MHGVDPITDRMIRAVLGYAEERLRLDPVPLDGGSRDPAELQAALDRVCQFSEANVSEVGGGEFPYYKRS